jgi:hypothetical protein
MAGPNWILGKPSIGPEQAGIPHPFSSLSNLLLYKYPNKKNSIQPKSSAEGNLA